MFQTAMAVVTEDEEPKTTVCLQRESAQMEGAIGEIWTYASVHVWAVTTEVWAPLAIHGVAYLGRK